MAAGWHLAYLLVSLGGALVVARSGADTPVAQAAADGGLLGIAALTLALWWGGTVLGTAVWWSGVLRVRAQSPRPSRTPPLP